MAQDLSICKASVNIIETFVNSYKGSEVSNIRHLWFNGPEALSEFSIIFFFSRLKKVWKSKQAVLCCCVKKFFLRSIKLGRKY